MVLYRLDRTMSNAISTLNNADAALIKDIPGLVSHKSGALRPGRAVFLFQSMRQGRPADAGRPCL